MTTNSCVRCGVTAGELPGWVHSINGDAHRWTCTRSEEVGLGKAVTFELIVDANFHPKLLTTFGDPLVTWFARDVASGASSSGDGRGRVQFGVDEMLMPMYGAGKSREPSYWEQPVSMLQRWARRVFAARRAA